MNNRLHEQYGKVGEAKKEVDLGKGNFPLSIRIKNKKEFQIENLFKEAEFFEKISRNDLSIKTYKKILEIFPNEEKALKKIKMLCMKEGE
jgi:hypothetical protein